MELIFVTGNALKFSMAQHMCSKHGITLVQNVADIDEIQGEDSELIARDKAQKAYDLVGKPVVISDDSWAFSGINGFPGPYMKSVNQWFTAKDFVNLTRDLTDRQVILSQYLVYKDEHETVLFQKDIRGTLLKEARGNYRSALLQVVALDSDDGKSMAEIYDADQAHTPERLAKHPEAWTELAEWYRKSHEKQS